MKAVIRGIHTEEVIELSHIDYEYEGISVNPILKIWAEDTLSDIPFIISDPRFACMGSEGISGKGYMRKVAIEGDLISYIYVSFFISF